MNTAKLALIGGAIFAGTAVAAGAFGAHGLAEKVTPERLATFATGAQYQMMHALALLIVGSLALPDTATGRSALLSWVTGCLLIGTLLFSGSLYALVLLDMPRLGIITPFGGVTWLIGWLLLTIWAIRLPGNHNKNTSL